MITIRFRLDFAPGSSVGPGKIDLLAAIEAEGSLSAAARQVGMSYRRAWLLLDSLNRSFDTPVTTASVGGRGGGGVTLTPFGRELVRGYREFAQDVGALAGKRFARLARAARPAGSVGPRSVTAARPEGRQRRPAKRPP